MLHHDPNGAMGGARHMAWRTADALAARGHDVAVAGTGPARGLDPSRAARRLGPGLPRSVGEAAERAGWVPEVVHVTDLADPTAASRGLALARSAGAIFALTPATDPALWSDWDAAGDLARQAAVVFTLTLTEARALAVLGVPPARIAPLGQGPQLEGRPDPDAFRARVGATGPLVLFLGRKLPSKGYQHLIRATPAIVERHPDATVVVAGPTPPSPGRPAAAASRTFPATPRGLRQLGPLDEVEKHSALVAADVLCLPTVADAFPLVFVEAWWCGTPVVSGPFPGAHEVVRDGVDGVITAADPAAVAAAVSGLLAEPDRREAMGRAGRHRAEAELGRRRRRRGEGLPRGRPPVAGPAPRCGRCRHRRPHADLTRRS
jgi:glycosyltransferase involved in cell wall biosynthesis